MFQILQNFRRWRNSLHGKQLTCITYDEALCASCYVTGNIKKAWHMISETTVADADLGMSDKMMKVLMLILESYESFFKDTECLNQLKKTMTVLHKYTEYGDILAVGIMLYWETQNTAISVAQVDCKTLMTKATHCLKIWADWFRSVGNEILQQESDLRVMLSLRFLRRIAELAIVNFQNFTAVTSLSYASRLAHLVKDGNIVRNVTQTIVTLIPQMGLQYVPSIYHYDPEKEDVFMDSVGLGKDGGLLCLTAIATHHLKTGQLHKFLLVRDAIYSQLPQYQVTGEIATVISFAAAVITRLEAEFLTLPGSGALKEMKAAAMDSEEVMRLRRLLQCAVCMAEYQDPRFLPCHHTLCLECIESIVQASSSTRRFFTCPHCREDFNVPRGGIKELPVNVYIASVQDVLGTNVGRVKPLQYALHKARSAFQRIGSIYSQLKHDFPRVKATRDIIGPWEIIHEYLCSIKLMGDILMYTGLTHQTKQLLLHGWSVADKFKLVTWTSIFSIRRIEHALIIDDLKAATYILQRAQSLLKYRLPTLESGLQHCHGTPTIDFVSSDKLTCGFQISSFEKEDNSVSCQYKEDLEQGMFSNLLEDTEPGGCETEDQTSTNDHPNYLILTDIKSCTSCCQTEIVSVCIHLMRLQAENLYTRNAEVQTACDHTEPDVNNIHSFLDIVEDIGKKASGFHTCNIFVASALLTRSHCKYITVLKASPDDDCQDAESIHNSKCVVSDGCKNAQGNSDIRCCCSVCCAVTEALSIATKKKQIWDNKLSLLLSSVKSDQSVETLKLSELVNVPDNTDFDSSVTASVASTSVTASSVASASVTASCLTASSAVTASVASTTVTASSVASASVPASSVTSSVASASVASASLTSASVASASVPASSVDSASMASASVPASSVTSASVTSASVTSVPVASASVASASVNSAASVTSASVASASVTSASVTSASVASASVASASVASASVTSSVASASVASASVASASVASVSVTSASVTSSVASASVTSSVASASVTSASVTSAFVTSAFVTSASVASASVASASVASSSVTSASVASVSVASASVASASVTSSVASVSVTSASVTSASVASASVTSSVASASVTSVSVASASVTSSVASASVASSSVTSASVASASVASASVTSSVASASVTSSEASASVTLSVASASEASASVTLSVTSSVTSSVASASVTPSVASASVVTASVASASVTASVASASVTASVTPSSVTTSSAIASSVAASSHHTDKQSWLEQLTKYFPSLAANQNVTERIGYLQTALQQFHEFPHSLLYRKISQSLALCLWEKQMTDVQDGTNETSSLQAEIAAHLTDSMHVTFQHMMTDNFCTKLSEKIIWKSYAEAEVEIEKQAIKKALNVLRFGDDVMEKFKDRLASIPADWTVVQMTIVDFDPTNPGKGQIFITRLNCAREPITIGLPNHRHQFLKIAQRSYTKGTCMCMPWQSRHILMNMTPYRSTFTSEIGDYLPKWKGTPVSVQETLFYLQEVFLGGYKWLLRGQLDCVRQDCVQKFLDAAGRRAVNTIVQQHGYRVCYTELRNLLEILLEANEADILSLVECMYPPHVASTVTQISMDVQNDVLRMCSTQWSEKRGPVILILDNELTCFPWENMPELTSDQVTRIPSFVSLISLLTWHKKMTRSPFTSGVECSSVTANICCTNTLKCKDREQLAAELKQYKGWQVDCGDAAKCFAELQPLLQNSSLYLYNGHNWKNYTYVQSTFGNALAIVLGCYTGTLKATKRMDGQGAPLYFLLAGCPAFVGNIRMLHGYQSIRLVSKLSSCWMAQSTAVSVRQRLVAASQAAENFGMCGTSFVIYGLPVMME